MGFRAKNAIITFVFIALCVAFMNAARLNGFVLYGTVVFIMLVNYFILYWLFNFDVHPQGFLTVLALPSITFGAYLLVYYNFIRDIDMVYRIVITLIFILLQYYLVLTQNILNLSHFSNIGLSQAALVVNNFYTIITYFLATKAIFLTPDITAPIKLVLTIPVFLILYIAFMIVNNIDFLQIIFGVGFYIILIAVFSFLYMSGFINPQNLLLIVISLAITFRGLTVISLYSSRKVISIPDFIVNVLESLLVGFLVYLSSF